MTATSLLVLFGCSASPSPSDAALAAAHSSSPPATPPTQPETRTDLTRRPSPIAATVDLHGASLTDDHWTEADANGLTTVIPIAAITLAGARMDITPTTADQSADRDADTKANAHRFRVVAEQTTSSGEWARLYQWRDGDLCFLTGGSPRARARCHSHEVKISCSAQALLDVCTSIAPNGSPITPKADLAATFPATADPVARAAMGAVAMAIMTDDHATFERYLAATGVDMVPRPHRPRVHLTPRQIHDQLARRSITTLASIECQDRCVWSDNLGEQPDRRAAMTPDPASFGMIRVLRFARQVDATWKLVAIDDQDLGNDR